MAHYIYWMNFSDKFTTILVFVLIVFVDDNLVLIYMEALVNYEEETLSGNSRIGSSAKSSGRQVEKIVNWIKYTNCMHGMK